jgi:hypothetical protein
VKADTFAYLQVFGIAAGKYARFVRECDEAAGSSTGSLIRRTS